ncbi:MAG TPA: HEPN domain-containing protein [Ferruginibacter sp.]|nr:HEPN domain-containing protein [Ferruginibacter sp.]
MRKQFIFVGDLIETDLTLPTSLFGSFILSKATDEQIITIKAFIDSYFNFLTNPINKFESKFTAHSDAKGVNVKIVGKDEWNYFVIEHDEHQAKEELQTIFALSELDLTILFEQLYPKFDSILTGTMYNQLRSLNYFHDNQFTGGALPIIKKFDNSSIAELNEINANLTSFKKENFPFIEKALKDLVSIKDISVQSPFKILSCFSILELLLTTYRPRTSNDSSLSSQLKKKITLINNQLKNEIKIDHYFKGPDTLKIENIIDKLYQYRNDIAHGNLSDFENDLQIFKSQRQQIFPFLLTVIRNILIFSLENPQLVSDLKEC